MDIFLRVFRKFTEGLYLKDDCLRSKYMRKVTFSCIMLKTRWSWNLAVFEVCLSSFQHYAWKDLKKRTSTQFPAYSQSGFFISWICMPLPWITISRFKRARPWCYDFMWKGLVILIKSFFSNINYRVDIIRTVYIT